MTAAWEQDPDWWKGSITQSPRFEKGIIYDFSMVGKQIGFRADVRGDQYETIENIWGLREYVTFRQVYCVGTLTSCSWFPKNLRPHDYQWGEYFVFVGRPIEFDLVGQKFVFLYSTYDCW